MDRVLGRNARWFFVDFGIAVSLTFVLAFTSHASLRWVSAFGILLWGCLMVFADDVQKEKE